MYDVKYAFDQNIWHIGSRSNRLETRISIKVHLKCSVSTYGTLVKGFNLN